MYNPDIHHRQSIRLRGYDYAGDGAYFVTVCVHERECLFGRISNGIMELNEAWRMVESVWQTLPERYPHIELDEYVIMPNHFHGIIYITDVVGAPLAAPAFDVHGYNNDAAIAENNDAATSVKDQGAAIAENNDAAIAENKGAASSVKDQSAASSVKDQGAASSAPTLGNIMRAFKSISAIEVNRILDRQGQPLWQRNYYERVIRNEKELTAIREYIVQNPAKWAEDKENPDYV